MRRLQERVEIEARREPFPIDEPIYRAAGRDPLEPILFGGSLDARVGFFGRDLGREEVRCGEPLIGAAGRMVRSGVHRALTGEEPAGDEDLALAARQVFLTNTVPYKPPGNRAYLEGVKRRFRPLLAELIVEVWSGDYLITLGNVAYRWFRPYGDRVALDAFWSDQERRYREVMEIEVTTDGGASRRLLIAPLPHPSPLNQRWYRQFPELLAARLQDRVF